MAGVSNNIFIQHFPTENLFQNINMSYKNAAVYTSSTILCKSREDRKLFFFCTFIYDILKENGIYESFIFIFYNMCRSI